MNRSSPLLGRRPVVLTLQAAAAAMALTIAGSSANANHFTWVGNQTIGPAANDWSLAANWQNANAPGASQSSEIYIQGNDGITSLPPNYGLNGEGTTTFGVGGDTTDQSWIGNSSTSGGGPTMIVSAGTLNFQSKFNTFQSSLWVGNGNNFAGTVLKQTGGTINLTNGLVIARDGANGNLLLTGGIFNVQGTQGTGIGGNIDGGNNSGTGAITFGVGNGLFEQTGSKTMVFGGTVGANSKINFLTVSAGDNTGTLSLLGATVSDFNSMIAAGDLFINGAVDKNTSDYLVTGAPNGSRQGTLQLAAVPEPASLSLLLGLGASAVLLHRRRYL